jgi:hypothetical protein
MVAGAGVVKASGPVVVVLALLAVSALACAGTPLGGGTGGRGGGGSGGSGGDVPTCIDPSACHAGQGGTGGVDTAVCGQLESAYAIAVTAASACTPGAPNQCQVLVATVPTECPDSACGQQTYVNDNSQIEPLRGQWLQTCDPGGIHSCPNTGPCDPQRPPSVCVSDGPGTTTGTCVPDGSPGGIAPDGGESCDQLVADYSAAVNAALACTPGAPNQCQALLDSLPTSCNNGCGATVAANDATAVNAAWNRWATQCSLALGCTLNICTPPPGTVGACVSVDGGTASGGICVTATPL